MATTRQRPTKQLQVMLVLEGVCLRAEQRWDQFRMPQNAVPGYPNIFANRKWEFCTGPTSLFFRQEPSDRDRFRLALAVNAGSHPVDSPEVTFSSLTPALLAGLSTGSLDLSHANGPCSTVQHQLFCHRDCHPPPYQVTDAHQVAQGRGCFNKLGLIFLPPFGQPQHREEKNERNAKHVASIWSATDGAKVESFHTFDKSPSAETYCQSARLQVDMTFKYRQRNASPPTTRHGPLWLVTFATTSSPYVPSLDSVHSLSLAPPSFFPTALQGVVGTSTRTRGHGWDTVILAGRIIFFASGVHEWFRLTTDSVATEDVLTDNSNGHCLCLVRRRPNCHKLAAVKIGDVELRKNPAKNEFWCPWPDHSSDLDATCVRQCQGQILTDNQTFVTHKIAHVAKSVTSLGKRSKFSNVLIWSVNCLSRQSLARLGKLG